ITYTDMQWVEVDNDTKLAYRTIGDGPLNLLFMHGWAGSGAYFDETIAFLDLTGIRVITYDLRGHGASDKPKQGYTLDQIAQDAIAVADHTSAAHFVVVGFSMSAKFAQYLATTYPDRVLGLILVAAFPVTEIPFPVETHHDWVGRAGDRERLIEVTRMFLAQPVRDDILERWGDDAVKIPAYVLDETLKTACQTSFSDRLDALQMPTLVVAGEQDPLYPPDIVASTVVDPLPHARLATLDCNHEIPIEKPRELAIMINSFLSELDAMQQ
ncbi:MAG: alpha/beta hydrolase, partial [Anaerolineae bacterium]|nr:alpha/beta hydrolase [Anaerolineae bacterium]